MKKVKHIFKSTSGELYIEKMITLIVILAVAVGIVGFLFVLQQKKTLDNMAIELTRCIQLNGQVTDDYHIMFDELSENMAPKPTGEIVTTYINGTGEIQLGTTIVVKLEQEVKILKTIPLLIKSKGVGNSEVYFKTE